MMIGGLIGRDIRDSAPFLSLPCEDTANYLHARKRILTVEQD